jgi:hypothetical protein
MTRQEMILKILKRFIPWIAGLATQETKPNKAKRVKTIIMSDMRFEFRKQSQMDYPHYFHSVARILGPFSGKNECYRSMSRKDRRNKAKQSQMG